MSTDETTPDPAEPIAYEAPALEVIGTVEESTLGPLEIGADGTGGFLS